MINYKKRLKNLPRILGANFFLILLVGISVGLTSCDKSSVIGLGVQPVSDLLSIGTIDTATIITKTEKVDSLRTDAALLYTGDVVMGNYWDPVFGKASSSLYTQMLLSYGSPDFGQNAAIDSVVLCLVYDTLYYGKKEIVPQKINVYQMSADMLSATSYFSNDTLSTNPNPNLGDLANGFNFTAQPRDSIRLHYQVLKPQLRVPLKHSFGDIILSQQNTGNLSTNALFQSIVKGLYITTEHTSTLQVGEGNMFHFLLSDAQSRVAIFYHNVTTPVDSSLEFDLGFANVNRFSHFSHNYSTTDPNLAAQLSTHPPKQNDVSFVQSLSGVKTKIEFPYIMNWIKSGAIAINKAQLIIKVDFGAPYQFSTFTAPAQLVLFGINDDGTNYALADASEGAPYFDGVYNPILGEYSFNIARYVQEILTGRAKNNGLDLVIAGGALNPTRVVIGGGGKSSAYQMKLDVAFTKLGRVMNAATSETGVAKKMDTKQQVIIHK